MLNQKLETFHVDEFGNRRPPNSSRPSGTGPGCYPAVEPTVTLESLSFTSSACGTLPPWATRVTFLISSANKIVAVNPNNSTQLTRGRMIVTKTATGAAVYTNNNITNTTTGSSVLTIVDAGIDPADPTRRLYRVTWLERNIPGNVYASANTVRMGLYYYTECPEESQYPYTAIGNSTNVGSGLTACDIVSNMDFTYPNILGVAACSCCTPNVIPSAQFVEFTPVGGGVPRSFILSPNQALIPSPQMNHGNYYVRYYNIGSNGCHGPWLSPSRLITW